MTLHPRPRISAVTLSLPRVVVDAEDDVGLIVAFLKGHAVLPETSHARLDLGSAELGQQEARLEDREAEKVGIQAKVAVRGEDRSES